MLIINEIISALEKEIDALNGGHGKAIITLIKVRLSEKLQPNLFINLPLIIF